MTPRGWWVPPPPTGVLLRRSLSAQSGSHWGFLLSCFYGMSASFNYIMSLFVLSKGVLLNILTLFMLLRELYYWYLYLIATKHVLYIARGFRCTWQLYRLQLITNIRPTVLSTRTILWHDCCQAPVKVQKQQIEANYLNWTSRLRSSLLVAWPQGHLTVVWRRPLGSECASTCWRSWAGGSAVWS
jgi:hypothetical protein